MTEQPLAPAAQAVLDAVREICPAPADEIAAAALRAAANIMRQAYENEGYVDSPDDWLDNIAAELEGADEPTFTPEEIEMIAAPWSYLQSQEELEGGQ